MSILYHRVIYRPTTMIPRTGNVILDLRFIIRLRFASVFSSKSKIKLESHEVMGEYLAFLFFILFV